jgi:hypothetical protein
MGKDNLEGLVQDTRTAAQQKDLIALIERTKKFMLDQGAYYYSVIEPQLGYTIRIKYTELDQSGKKELEVYFERPDGKGKQMVLAYDFNKQKLKEYKKGEWKDVLRHTLNDNTPWFDDYP